MNSIRVTQHMVPIYTMTVSTTTAALSPHCPLSSSTILRYIHTRTDRHRPLPTKETTRKGSTPMVTVLVILCSLYVPALLQTRPRCTCKISVAARAACHHALPASALWPHHTNNHTNSNPAPVPPPNPLAPAPSADLSVYIHRSSH